MVITGIASDSFATLIMSEIANVGLDANHVGEDMAAEHETKPRDGSALRTSRGQLREVAWVRASILIFTSDGHVLMGQKDPTRRKNHLNAWHFPCGEVRQGESLEDAAVRLVGEKAGLQLAPEQFSLLPFVGEDEAVKTLDTGEIVWCRVKLKRFEVRLDQTASQLKAQIRPGRDLLALRFLSLQDVSDVDLIPGVWEFLVRAGYIKADNSHSHYADEG
jgi:8-oxo-dGTP pyrophosphatase MutT (NUDIX family)